MTVSLLWMETQKTPPTPLTTGKNSLAGILNALLLNRTWLVLPWDVQHVGAPSRSPVHLLPFSHAHLTIYEWLLFPRLLPISVDLIVVCPLVSGGIALNCINFNFFFLFYFQNPRRLPGLIITYIKEGIALRGESIHPAGGDPVEKVSNLSRLPYLEIFAWKISRKRISFSSFSCHGILSYFS